MNHIKKRDDIWVYEDAFKNSESVVNRLLEPDIISTDWTDLRKVVIGKNYQIHKNTDVYDELNSCISKAILEFSEFHKVPMESIDDDHYSFNVRNYFPGVKMAAHTDTIFRNPEMTDGVEPFAVICLYLSSNFEGGQIGFPDIDFYLKPKAGTLVIFKGSALHEFTELLSGDRYILMVDYLYNK